MRQRFFPVSFSMSGSPVVFLFSLDFLLSDKV